MLVPTTITTEENKTLVGVFLDEEELTELIDTIERHSADGLKLADSAFLFRLKDALRTIRKGN